MKSVLIIETPNNCSECPCCHENECGNQYKGYVGDYLGWNSGRPSWCPLKPLPEQMTWGHTVDYIEGYNACIEEIEK